jgi:hypothetical protein
MIDPAEAQKRLEACYAAAEQSRLEGLKRKHKNS